MTYLGPDGRPIPGSKPTGQDAAVKEVKSYSALFLVLLKNWKGKKKDATVKASAKGYFKDLNRKLPGLFSKRWERSSAQAHWNNFVVVWNDGECAWTDAYEALEPLNDALQQSD
jgi:hypothetical protein